MTQKEIDLELERQFGFFLSTKLYPKHNIKVFERVTDQKRQQLGIDIILEDGTKVDEKSQLSYINQGLHTFAFELDFIRTKGNHTTTGWLCNSKLETEAYFLCRHIYTYDEKDNKKKIYEKIKSNQNINFKSALVQRLDKKDLFQQLMDDKLDDKKLLDYARSIRKYCDSNTIEEGHIANSGLYIYKIEEYDSGNRVYIKLPELEKKKAYITYTSYLDELPINLVLTDTYLSKAKVKRIAHGEA